MCTAVTYRTKDFYFGRTLDYDFAYPSEVTVTPRNFPMVFRRAGKLERHYAIIGMAYVADGYPLYFDAVNEKGLGMAGLNFVESARYRAVEAERENIAQFELIPWVLGQCASVREARELLEGTNITGEAFSHALPAARLHWMIADREGAITVEAVKEGLRVYENPVGVLTNEPSFDHQLWNLKNFMGLSPREPENRFSKQLPLRPDSRGMGALGLPGDLSSQSRFVRAAFVKLNSVSGTSEGESVSQFFHILGTVEQPRGCCSLGEDRYEYTLYAACCNASQGIYYYRTYESRRLAGVDLRREDLEGRELVRYPLDAGTEIRMQN